MIVVFLTAVLWCTSNVKPTNSSVLESNKIDVFSSCFPTHIEISFLLESFPGVNLSALHLRSPLCKPTRNSTHVTFKAPLFGCETRLVETSKKMYTFDNVVQGVRPSIKVKCAYHKKHIIASRNKENGEYPITAQLTMYQDSQLSRPILPGRVVRFESPIPQDLFFDLQITPNQKNMRVCMFVKLCQLHVQNKVLPLMKKGQENKMTTRVIFTSAERIIFRFNASLLVTPINLNTKLKLFCIVNGYHDNATHGSEDCSGNHSNRHHGNASACQELRERQDSKDTGRNSRHCTCEQDGATTANDQANQRKDSCDQICGNGSKVHNSTSYSTNDRKPRRKRAVKEQSLRSVIRQEKNNTAKSSYDLIRHYSDRASQNPTPKVISRKVSLCSSSEWDGKPVVLQVEREWVAKPSIPENGLKWTENHEPRHLSRNMKDGNATKVTQAVRSTRERIPSAALLLACSYLSLLLVIGPVLLVYLWDRRNHKKRRQHQRRTRYVRGYSGARVLLTRDQTVA